MKKQDTIRVKKIITKLNKGEEINMDEFNFCKNHTELFEKYKFKKAGGENGLCRNRQEKV